jgi:putative ABC transport system substrate-binding protein
MAARGQSSAMPVIGLLHNTTAAAMANRVTAFRQGLNEVGFIEGHNVTIEFRWAENQLDRLPVLAADLVRRQVMVIVANAESTPSAKGATSTHARHQAT